MDNATSSANSHIENYLIDYCTLSSSPKFAVLIKGNWGSGKTTFIKNFQVKMQNLLKSKDEAEQEKTKTKILYVSLYGMTALSEIDSALFKEVIPLFKKQGMVIASKFLMQSLRLTANIDINKDGKPDGNFSFSGSSLREILSLRVDDRGILIFDDLERCEIDISRLFRYINYFVEHQGMKVILIANEEEILKKEMRNSIKNEEEQTQYELMREKLVGMTYEVSPDVQEAFRDFISLLDGQRILSNREDRSLALRNFLLENSQVLDLVKNNYPPDGNHNLGYCKNLRILRQVLLDFKRIYDAMSSNFSQNEDILFELFENLLILSIELKGDSSYYLSINKKYQKVYENMGYSPPEEGKLEIILKEYPCQKGKEPFPSPKWWHDFFSKGIIDKRILEHECSAKSAFS